MGGRANNYVFHKKKNAGGTLIKALQLRYWKTPSILIVKMSR
uniref:Uncharacterized protein n=1 Tax=Arundo donax TaxID=35708 RepID=A0A0A9FND8_ARUDO